MVPWRSDCLIQAIAAKMWLNSLGIPSECRLAADAKPSGLCAHAWLLSDGQVVTGGPLDTRMTMFQPAGDA